MHSMCSKAFFVYSHESSYNKTNTISLRFLTTQAVENNVPNANPLYPL
jgi:hypothetical protein